MDNRIKPFIKFIILFILLNLLTFCIICSVWKNYDIWVGNGALSTFVVSLCLCAIVSGLIIFCSVLHKYISKKLFAWILAFLITAIIFGGWMYGFKSVYPAEFEEAYGETIEVENDKHSYLYDEASKTLTIKGDGPLCSTRNNQKMPWSDYDIKELIIEEGVTGIGYGDFSGCTHLESVQLPDSLLYISMRSFEDCTSLKNVSLPDKLLILRNSAFVNCSSLEKLFIPNGLNEIQPGAFDGCINIHFEAEERGRYTVQDEVLFDTVNQSIVCYPASKTDKAYTIDKGITDDSFAWGNIYLQMISLPEEFDAETDVFVGCSSLELIFVPSGSKAAEWAKETSFTVIEDLEMPNNTTALDFMTEYCNQQYDSIDYSEWRKLYYVSFIGSNKFDDALTQAEHYKEIIDVMYPEYVNDKLELGIPEISSHDFNGTSGTFHYEYYWSMGYNSLIDAEAWIDKCGESPEGKVLPVLSYGDDIVLLPELLVSLPDERIPSKLSDVEYILNIGYNSYKYGTYTDGSTAYTISFEIKLIDAKTGNLLDTMTVTGGAPPTTAIAHTGHEYGDVPTDDIQAELIRKLLSEIE